MARCQNVHIASIIKPNVSSRKWKRNGILPKGELIVDPSCGDELKEHRAKYIEGLENRLGRMESLLKLSGLLNEKDGDRTDLGTLEKRLADKASTQSALESPENGSNLVSQPSDSQRNTPPLEKVLTPRSSATTPDSPKEHEEEVEALSDMMCSLVTNNCGETKYIGSVPTNRRFRTS